MRGNTKVRVKTAELLTAVRAKKDAQDKAYNKARDEYPAKFERYRTAIVAELRAAADKIEKGGRVPTQQYGYPGVRFTAEKPCEPSRDQALERTIKTLEMAADDAIAITADDYARYLGV